MLLVPRSEGDDELAKMLQESWDYWNSATPEEVEDQLRGLIEAVEAVKPAAPPAAPSPESPDATQSPRQPSNRE
jgi:hypothetical protein